MFPTPFVAMHSFVEYLILVSIVVSIPACHAGDRGSIPRRGDTFFPAFMKIGKVREVRILTGIFLFRI